MLDYLKANPEATRTDVIRISTSLTYAELVRKAKAEIHARKHYGNNRITYKPCKTLLDGDQINLWTYWQGYQIHHVEFGVDILLVGQDWGNPDRNPDVISRIERIQASDKSSSYDCYKSPTDRMLTELFWEFGCDITSSDPGLRLFFTNNSLGYRDGRESGGMTKGLLKEDQELFNDLVDSIRPKVIICLGKMVFEAVSETTTPGFLKQVKRGQPFVSSDPRYYPRPVYGVPHCGARGVSNVGGKDTMIRIWRQIAAETGLNGGHHKR